MCVSICAVTNGGDAFSITTPTSTGAANAGSAIAAATTDLANAQTALTNAQTALTAAQATLTTNQAALVTAQTALTAATANSRGNRSSGTHGRSNCFGQRFGQFCDSFWSWHQCNI